MAKAIKKLPKKLPADLESFTPPQVATDWKTSPDKIIELIRSGELEAFDFSVSRSGRRRYRITREAMERFIRSRLIVPDGGLSTTQRLRRRSQKAVKNFF